MFNKSDISRNQCQLFGGQAKLGYDWWWHSFTAIDSESGEEKPFFLEFFVCNPASGQNKPVFGQLPANQEKGIRPSYLMIKAGTWGEDARQIHNFYGWNEITVDMNVPFSVKAGQCYLSEDKTWGKVSLSKEEAESHPEYMSSYGEISWNLTIDKKIAFNVGYGASSLFRKIQAFEMFWHAEGMKSAYSGEIFYNGHRYNVIPDKCYGYADKNWGKDFTSPWVWLSSNNLTSNLTGRKLENSVFDIGGGRPKVGPIALNRKLLSAFWYEGKPFEFNFSKFWTFTKTSFNSTETEDEIIWHVEQSNLTSRMVTDITCKKKDMLLVNYEAPNGKKLHNRLWNGGNGIGTVRLYHFGKLIDEISCANVGCEYGEYNAAKN